MVNKINTQPLNKVLVQTKALLGLLQHKLHQQTPIFQGHPVILSQTQDRRGWKRREVFAFVGLSYPQANPFLLLPGIAGARGVVSMIS